MEILEIHLHGPPTERYDVTDGSNPQVVPVRAGAGLHAGSHNRVHLMAQHVDFGRVFQEELIRPGRGKMVVSGKTHHSVMP